jgi:hypothetical protein
MLPSPPPPPTHTHIFREMMRPYKCCPHVNNDVKWLEQWTISTDNIWKVFRLELKDILIQQQFVFIGKDWTISISDDIRVNNYTNCETIGAGSTDLFRIFEFTTVVYGVRVSPSSFKYCEPLCSRFLVSRNHLSRISWYRIHWNIYSHYASVVWMLLHINGMLNSSQWS